MTEEMEQLGMHKDSVIHSSSESVLLTFPVVYAMSGQILDEIESDTKKIWWSQRLHAKETGGSTDDVFIEVKSSLTILRFHSMLQTAHYSNVSLRQSRVSVFAGERHIPCYSLHTHKYYK